jgi:hypothetical protein
MSLLLRLLLGHLLADYVLQPRSLVLMKRRGWLGVLVHATIVVVVTGLLLWPVLHHWWYWLCLALLTISHSVIDARRALVWTDSRQRGLLYLAVDQALHVGVLLAVAAITFLATGLYSSIPVLDTNPQGDSLVLHLIVLVFLVSTVPVVELHARTTLAGGGERQAIEARDRLLGAMERIGGVGLILVGLALLTPLAYLPRLLLQRREWRDSTLRPYLFVQTAVSLCSATFCGLVLLRAPALVL